MHGVQGSHAQTAQPQAGHVVGHAGHPAGLEAAVHVGVGTETLCEWRGICHGSVKPENRKC